MNLTQEIVDKISDEFMSTFSMTSPTTMCNLFAPNEIPKVTEIVIKHTGAKHVGFFINNEIDKNYYSWLILVTE